MIRRIIPSEHPEWQTATVCLSRDDPEFWDLTTVSDAALVRLRVRHYGLDFLTECRCLIGTSSHHWVQVARFTYPIFDLWEYADVDVSLFPPIATTLFAGLAEYWSDVAGLDDCSPARIGYLDGDPVYYPLPTDPHQFILFADADAPPLEG